MGRWERIFWIILAIVVIIALRECARRDALGNPFLNTVQQQNQVDMKRGLEEGKGKQR